MMWQVDYKLLAALAAVVKHQSFERAAQEICITQSAISQRIKQLEQFIGQSVLIRTQPIKATEIGQKLIKHFYQVSQLESALQTEISPNKRHEITKLYLASNTDSLATWLIPALADTLKTQHVELNLLLADEQYTIEKLKSGEVFGAITLEQKAITGCESTRLGNLEYVLVCTESFKQRFFKNGVTPASLLTAPSAAFDHRDNMHTQFIETHFGLQKGQYPLHTVGSSEAFVMLAMQGVAFCLVAKQQISSKLDSGALVNLLPELSFSKTLYWQRWQLLKGVHQSVSDAIIKNGQALLK